MAKLLVFQKGQFLINNTVYMATEFYSVSKLLQIGGCPKDCVKMLLSTFWWGALRAASEVTVTVSPSWCRHATVLSIRKCAETIEDELAKVMCS